ncbi:hypothetical protein Tco_0815835 [Tanacetum coccineum]
MDSSFGCTIMKKSSLSWGYGGGWDDCHKVPNGVLKVLESIRSNFLKVQHVGEQNFMDCLGSDVVLDTSFRRSVRGGVEQQEFSDLSSFLNSVVLSTYNDRWYFSLSSSGEFSVKDTRLAIDDLVLPSHSLRGGR